MNGAKLLLAAAPLLAAVTGEPANAGDQRSWPTFRQADRDASGALTLEEVRDVRGLVDNFALHDKNSDGKLSRAEFEAAKRANGTGGTQDAGRAAGTGAAR